MQMIQMLLQKFVWGLLKAVLSGGIPASTQGRYISDTWRYACSGVQSNWDWSTSVLHCCSRHCDPLWRRARQTRGESTL